jgi:DNA-binding GntR family transcriptional regulator
MINISLPNNLYFGTKSDYVVESIRTAILVGDLSPGTRITEQEVKNVLNVSSSPVREAFRELEVEGLLTRNPHTGSKVSEMDIGDAKELYFIQSLLQGTVVQISTRNLKEEDILEAERLNEEMKKMYEGEIDIKGLRVVNYKLHMLLCGASVYPWLTRLISACWVRLSSQSLWMIPNRPKVSYQQHKKIISAVKKRDATLAGSLMTKHLESSMNALFRGK